MMVFSIFSPKELKQKILDIGKIQDRNVVSVSLEYNEETNLDMIVFHKANQAVSRCSLISFGKENADAMNMSSPITVDLIEFNNQTEQYMFIEQVTNSFVSNPTSLAKKVLA